MSDDLKKWGQAIYRDPLARAGILLLALFCLIAVAGPWLAPHDPRARHTGADGRLARLQPPSAQFWFGTNDIGNDVLSQVLIGARVALQVGVLAATIVTVIGTAVGLLAGYKGGWIDSLLMRTVDVLYAIPFIPFVLVLVSLLRPSIWNIILAISILSWRTVARLVRAQVLTIRQRAYVQAAKVAGASDARIIMVHIFPSILPLALLEMAFSIALVIQAEASISFLGLGDPSTISWGGLLNQAFGSSAVREAWWWVAPPAISIVAVVTSVFFVTRALEPVVNPRLREH